MIIEIDCGNTRAKWRRESDEVHVHAYSEKFAASKLAAALRDAERVRLAAVKVNEFVEQLIQNCDSHGVAVDIAVTAKHAAGVTNSYEDVSRMGVDRWLAIVAAYNHHKQACVVIDAGTALTVDCIDDSGVHRGGLIVPGKQLLLQSLNQNTSKVVFPLDGKLGPLLPGCSTQEAVYNGATHMLAGTVHEAVDSFRASVGHEINIYLAGGDAGELMPSLRIELEKWPDIVLDGLRYLVP
jgi:type III pantothenate kinase